MERGQKKISPPAQTTLSLSLFLSLLQAKTIKKIRALQLRETLKEAITAYTGLSPATFFTVLALVFAIYYVVSDLFGPSETHHARPRSVDEVPPRPLPVQLGEITEDELKKYDGADPEKPLLMAIKGQIYDVSQSRSLLKVSAIFPFYF